MTPEYANNYILAKSIRSISAHVSELPVPQDCNIEGMSVDDAVEVCLFILIYCIQYLQTEYMILGG